MAKASGIPDDPELREILLNLGNAILPLAEWIKGRPAPMPDAPWRRQGYFLTLKELRALEVIDRLMREEDTEVDGRWAALSKEPLANFPDPLGAKAWRAARGLEAKASFRMDATNWPTPVDPVLLDPKGDLPLPVSRPTLYAACWASLKAVAKAAGGGADWSKLAQALLDGTAPGWDPKAPPSPRFLRTYARDLLIATMGMKNADAGEVAFALLVELREGRRVGNQHTREDVDTARLAFEAKLREKLRP